MPFQQRPVAGCPPGGVKSDEIEWRRIGCAVVRRVRNFVQMRHLSDAQFMQNFSRLFFPPLVNLFALKARQQPDGLLAAQTRFIYGQSSSLQAFSRKMDGSLWLLDVDSMQSQLIAPKPPGIGEIVVNASLSIHSGSLSPAPSYFRPSEKR